MKRTVYLLVITLITIGCVIYGTVGITRSGWGIWTFGSGDDTKEEFSNLDSFGSIVVDGDVMELIIKEGNEAKLSYSCTEDLEPEWWIADGDLKITNKKSRKIFWGRHNCEVILTVPGDTQLKSIVVQTDVGDVKLNDITADYCNLETNVGDIKLEKTVFADAVITSDTGDVKLQDSAFDTIDVSSDVGNVKIDSVHSLEGYRFDLKTDVGEVELNGEEYGRKYKVDGQKGSITVVADVGDVEIKY